MWVSLLASALLALWVLVRFPDLRPKSVFTAIVVFLAAQLVPNIGLALMPAVMRLPHGPQLALIGIVLPAFFLLWLTLAWLLRAVGDGIGGPRGGHRVQHRPGLVTRSRGAAR